MPSQALLKWQTDRAGELDQIVAAHRAVVAVNRAVGGSGRGRPISTQKTTQQINHAYAMLLSSQFQGFCRDLHTESIDYLVLTVSPINLQKILKHELGGSRKLDRGNPNPGNIGSDFDRFGLTFWPQVQLIDPLNAARQTALTQLNEWRNAIAHQDFDPARLGGLRALHLRHVSDWRKACQGLAESFDRVLQVHIQVLTGQLPW